MVARGRRRVSEGAPATGAALPDPLFQRAKADDHCHQAQQLAGGTGQGSARVGLAEQHALPRGGRLEKTWTPEDRAKVEHSLKDSAQQAMRTLAFGYALLPPDMPETEDGL